MSLLNFDEMAVALGQLRSRRPPPDHPIRCSRSPDVPTLSPDGDQGWVVRTLPVGPMVVVTAGSPTTLVLGGSLDAAFTPVLNAAMAAVAATGTLRVDAAAVDRFDPTIWAALFAGCGRAAITGVNVVVTGLRWAQVLDVLAAAPVSEVAALMAAVRALGPEHRYPTTVRSQPDSPAAVGGRRVR